MTLQVLKYLIQNSQWLPKTQPELFEGELETIFKIAQAMEAKNIKPTYDAIKYTLTKKDLLSANAVLPDVWAAGELDESTFRLVRTDLRLQALRNLVQRYAALGDLDEKTFNTFNKRMGALSQEDEPENLQKSVSFFDFNQHISPVGMLVGSGLGFLQNTGSDWCKSNLIAMLAPSNQGKSQSLAHTAKYLFDSGRNVLVIVFEETAEDVPFPLDAVAKARYKFTGDIPALYGIT